MNAVYFLNTLHSHVSAEDYEQWVRTVDYPTARSIPSIEEYTVWQAGGLLEGDDDSPYQYIERVLITDLATYRADLQDPRLGDFGQQWSSYVAKSVAVTCTLVE